MGSPQNEPGRYSNESLSHRVTISKGFYISKTEITQKQWAQVMGYYESEWRGDNLPVQRVSWNQIQEFIQKLNDTQNQYTYRLPTEAEWEYAARAGTNTLWSFGNEKSMLDVYGWCESSAGQKPHEVGTKKPNPWGLYDMHGNVWEWVSDWYKKAPAPVDATDPQGPQSGNQKTYRGGGFGCTRCCRSAARYGIEPDFGVNDIGFRLVRE
jgi:formylglycine-generating enzyme required for sulfatase activity